MSIIPYRVTYYDGETEQIEVKARTINSGFVKALRAARMPLGSGRVREINRVEFWRVTS